MNAISQNHGLILAVRLLPGGTNPGPASRITYDVLISFGDGRPPMTAQGMVPATPRVPDSLSDVRAFAVNDNVPVVGLGQPGNELFLLMFSEWPDAAPCAPQGGP
jgi:hypothetical protein